VVEEQLMQCTNYRKVPGLQLCLLLDFGKPCLEIKRVAHYHSFHLAVICVFCVHRLPASALRFLLCDAADRLLRTSCDAADARSVAIDGIRPIAIGRRFPATVPTPRRNGLASSTLLPEEVEFPLASTAIEFV
jgi:hypothetical protein